MANISALRRLVNSGFTIANRKGLEKLIGEDELARLFAKYSECKPRVLWYKLPNHEKEISILDFKLNNSGNNYQLSLTTEIVESSAKGTKFKFSDI